MPVMDGFQATTAIRAREAAEGLTRTPIVAISASVYDTSGEELREHGFDDFVTKPIEEAALFGSLERLLGLRFEARAAAAPAPEVGWEALAAQPPEWRERFRALVAIGDLGAAEELLPELTDAPLVEALTRHLRAYHLQELLDHLG
jgi:CheY-like chemotaxis protein